MKLRPQPGDRMVDRNGYYTVYDIVGTATIRYRYDTDKPHSELRFADLELKTRIHENVLADRARDHVRSNIVGGKKPAAVHADLVSLCRSLHHRLYIGASPNTNIDITDLFDDDEVGERSHGTDYRIAFLLDAPVEQLRRLHNGAVTVNNHNIALSCKSLFVALLAAGSKIGVNTPQ